MSKNTVPAPAWGWPTGVTLVEATRISERGAHLAIDRVYVNGKQVGHVVGRKPSLHKAREWDYVVGSVKPSANEIVRLVFPTTMRQHALCALAEAAQRNTREA